MEFAFFSAGLAVLLAIILLAWKLKRSRTLRGANLKRIEHAWQHATSQENPILKIVEADKVLDIALTFLGYSGSLGEKLKKAGPRFSDLNGLWAAHKLRNILVHSLQSKPSTVDVDRAMRAFERALRDVGMR